MIQNPAFAGFFTPEVAADLQSAFDQGDLNADGQMDEAEFVGFMEEYGVDEETAMELFAALDEDASGGVSLGRKK